MFHAAGRAGHSAGRPVVVPARLPRADSGRCSATRAITRPRGRPLWDWSTRRGGLGALRVRRGAWRRGRRLGPCTRTRGRFTRGPDGRISSCRARQPTSSSPPRPDDLPADPRINPNLARHLNHDQPLISELSGRLQDRRTRLPTDARWRPLFTVLSREALRDTRPMEWYEQARAAEQIQDWDTAIALVSARAECYSADSYAHDSHLWHMRLLVSAERFTQLTELALTDVHARRRLNRSLHERGMDTVLHHRAEDGDSGALYHLVKLLCETGRLQEACRAVRDLGPEDEYAHQLVADFRTSTSGAR